MKLRHTRIVAIVVTVGIAASACSTSSGTQQIESTPSGEQSSAPTTSIVRTQLPTTTTLPARAAAVPAVATGDQLAGTFGSLVGALAADPSLAQLLAGGLELPDLAQLAGLDLAALEQLALTPAQLEALAGSVLAQQPPVIEQLALGQLDPAALLAVLGNAVPAGELASGAVGAIVAALIAAIGDLSINPQLTLQLGTLLDGLDPSQLGNISADPTNAAFFALLLSAFIGSNPVLAQQLLSNELLDPALRDLLTQLQALNATLSDAATQALLETLRQLFPGLIPR